MVVGDCELHELSPGFLPLRDDLFTPGDIIERVIDEFMYIVWMSITNKCLEHCFDARMTTVTFATIVEKQINTAVRLVVPDVRDIDAVRSRSTRQSGMKKCVIGHTEHSSEVRSIQESYITL